MCMYRSLPAATTSTGMMAEVPKADVVITDPTHLAIALRVQSDESGQVSSAEGRLRGQSASGRRPRAQRANHKGRPLAQTLFEMTKLALRTGQPVPRYQPKFLAFIWPRRSRSLDPSACFESL